MCDLFEPHLRPFQKPYLPIAVAGLSKNSDTLKMAGEYGFLPMRLNLNTGYVKSHWDAVEEEAKRSGRTPQRADWRLVREVFLAETDEEARKLSVASMIGRQMREYFLRLLGTFGFNESLKHDPGVPDSDITVEYCARLNWLIGSPKTVAEKLRHVYDEVGGFGVLLVFGFDYAENPGAWHTLMRLLKEEVLPLCADLVPGQAVMA